jgi:hypothetical protein
MLAKHVALLTLLAVVGSGCALSAQPPDAPPPPNDPSAQGQDQSAPADGQVDVNFFYTNLAPYGHWVQAPDYGSIWLPFNVASGWRPYSLGHWVMTDYGWTWVSDESFGWATYHYGRWVNEPNYGWGWVPGYDWGPAWVAWRNGGGYIGWAPLPPQVTWSAGAGLNLAGVNLDVVLAPTQYCFVPERSFLEPQLQTYIAPPARNVTFIRSAPNVTNYSVAGGRVVNQGVAVAHIEQVTGKRVAVLKVAATATGKPRGNQVSGSQLTVFRPTVVKRAGTPPPPPPSSRASSATLARQHVQETQNLQKSQAAESARLQQIHTTEAAGAAKGAPPANRTAPQPQEKQAAPKAAASPQLEQQHQAEVKAQQAQHLTEQHQLQARHQAEQAQAKAAPQQHDNAAPSGQKEPPKKEDNKRPEPPPPGSR